MCCRKFKKISLYWKVKNKIFIELVYGEDQWVQQLFYNIYR